MAWLTKTACKQWQQGVWHDSYDRMGAHPNAQGTHFTVWAPEADAVSVVGDFNGWDVAAHPLVRQSGGLWTGYIRGAKAGHHYKYHIRRGTYTANKTDPYAFAMEAPLPDGNPMMGLSSIVTDRTYTWQDTAWMAERGERQRLECPISIYEVHLGSWQRDDEGYSLGYREIAAPLAAYVREMGFTHVEFLPVMEHPYYPSWGYQVVGYFAPTHRYGSPHDLMYLIDYLHQQGIGVLMDWVPAHFAADPQGLVFFDGSACYEPEDPVMRYHPDWGTYIFDYSKPEVRNFLLSNALYWLDVYHIDGLRVDAVASMLYLDYSRDVWTPNAKGGRENLGAIELLQATSAAIQQTFPDTLLIAEESTAWPRVTGAPEDDGLGFTYKWNMGWMHDTLRYMEQDPIYRKHHHNDLTFPLMYAYDEQFMLPLSHDEVVHMKGSLWGKMPGDTWQKAANLRLLLGHLIGHPGKVLLFMGGEMGQPSEWNHDAALPWHLLENPYHGGIQAWFKDLNHLYRTHAALWDDSPKGFTWVDFSDYNQSIVSYLRQYDGAQLLFVFNFTPVPRDYYPVGVPQPGRWREVLNSDAHQYGGSGVGNAGSVQSTVQAFHGYRDTLRLFIPPLGMLVLEHVPEAAEEDEAVIEPVDPTA